MTQRAWLATWNGDVRGETVCEDDYPPRLEHAGEAFRLVEVREDGSAVYVGLSPDELVDHSLPHGLCMLCLAEGREPPVMTPAAEQDGA